LCPKVMADELKITGGNQYVRPALTRKEIRCSLFDIHWYDVFIFSILIMAIFKLLFEIFYSTNDKKVVLTRKDRNYWYFLVYFLWAASDYTEYNNLMLQSVLKLGFNIKMWSSLKSLSTLFFILCSSISSKICIAFEL